MKKIVIHELAASVYENESNILQLAAKKMGILPEQIQRWGILRKSLDARKKNDILYKYSLWIQPEEKLIPRLEKKDLKPMKP